MGIYFNYQGVNEMDVKFLGIEEVEMVCQFCGKKEIGRAFVFLDLETGNFVRYGSQCAKKALGFSTKAKMGEKLRRDIESDFQNNCNQARMNGTFNIELVNTLSAKKQKALDEIRKIGF